MSSTQMFLAAVGLFYAVAGIVAGRAALADAWLNSAFNAISGRRDAIETERTWWLVAGAAVVSAGGLLLVVGSVWAVVPFIVSAVTQALYLLVLAPRRYDHVDPPSPEGRRRTVNAFGIYGAMTVVVCRSAWIGMLRPISRTSFAALAGITILWVVGATYAVRQLIAMARMPAPDAE